jgi:hypothetical protein
MDLPSVYCPLQQLALTLLRRCALDYGVTIAKGRVQLLAIVGVTSHQRSSHQRRHRHRHCHRHRHSEPDVRARRERAHHAMIRSLNAMLFQHRQQSASITKAVDARARAQPSASPISTPPESPPSDDLATGLWSCQWPTASQAAAAAAGWEAVDTVASAEFEDRCQFQFDDHEAWVSVSISDSESDGDGQHERAHGLSGFVAVAQTQVAGATAIILSEPAADPPVIPSTPKPVAADASNPDQAVRQASHPHAQLHPTYQSLIHHTV